MPQLTAAEDDTTGNIRLTVLSGSRQFIALVRWAIDFLPSGVTGEMTIIDGALSDVEERVSEQVRKGKSTMVYGGLLHSSRVLQLTRLGASAYVPDTAPLKVFLDAVKTTAENGTHLPFYPTRTAPSRLTPHEKLAADAYLLENPTARRSEVANMLGIADATLRNHIAAVRRKIGAGPRTSRQALSRYYKATQDIHNSKNHVQAPRKHNGPENFGHA